MGFLRQIMDDTASLGRDVRRGLEHVRWRLSWWRRRRGIQVEREEAEAENVRRSIAAASKMCRECRALIPASASACPECGAGTAHIRSGGAGRALSSILPFEPSVSMVLVSCFFVLFLGGVFASMRIVDARQGGEISVFGVVMNLDGEALLRSGANTGTFVEAEFPGQSSRSQPWRLLTAIFLHAGLMHIVFNTWALVTIGPLIEHLYGPRKMFVLYLVTGVLSNVASLWWHGARLLQVGASGAIFGLIGVAAVYGMRRGDALGENLKRQMMTWAVYGVMMGFFLKADNAAHIGGFLAGAAAGFVVEDAGVRRGALPDRAWAIMAGLGAAAAVGSFALIALAWAQSA